MHGLIFIRTDASLSLGVAGYDKKPAEEANIKFRRSLYFVKDMKEGDLITPDCIRRVRPGYGAKIKNFKKIIGKK